MARMDVNPNIDEPRPHAMSRSYAMVTPLDEKKLNSPLPREVCREIPRRPLFPLLLERPIVNKCLHLLLRERAPVFEHAVKIYRKQVRGMSKNARDSVIASAP